MLLKKAFKSGFPSLACACNETGELGVVGGRDGASLLFDISIGNKRNELHKPSHVGDVNTLKFFPSGKVILSGSADTTLGIWDAPTGRRATTLSKGHSRGILSTAIIEKGRSILSSSRDGSICLWDVPTQKVISKPHVGESPINALTINQEDETKLVLFGMDNKTMKAIDLKSNNEVFSMSFNSPCTSCIALSSPTGGIMLIGGSENGEIYSFDSRNIKTPFIGPFKRSDAIITDIQKGPKSSSTSSSGGKLFVFISSSDGQLWLQDFLTTNTNASIITEMTDRDYEPIMSFGTFNFGCGVISTSRDGTIRQFEIQTSLIC